MIVHPPNGINPLSSILSLFPTRSPVVLNTQALSLIDTFLFTAGTICESTDDVLHALKVLDTMGVLEVSLTKNNTILIGNLYNGK